MWQKTVEQVQRAILLVDWKAVSKDTCEEFYASEFENFDEIEFFFFFSKRQVTCPFHGGVKEDNSISYNEIIFKLIRFSTNKKNVLETVSQLLPVSLL